jgi:hypothetical protein
MEEPTDDQERTRPPLIGDLVDLCRELNQRGAIYIVVGGMAINIHGFARNTEDIDLLIETTVENEAKILEALSLLPEGAARELKAGEVADYVVVRVCDEITVDLMAKACGHETNPRYKPFVRRMKSTDHFSEDCLKIAASGPWNHKPGKKNEPQMNTDGH